MIPALIVISAETIKPGKTMMEAIDEICSREMDALFNELVATGEKDNEDIEAVLDNKL